MSERTNTSELEDMQRSRYLAFTVGSETYGIEIGNVKEIIGLQPITPLPEAPSHVHMMLGSKANWVPVHAGPEDERSDDYPQESLEDWHRAHGMLDGGP